MLLAVHTNIHTYLAHQGEVPQAHHINTTNVATAPKFNNHAQLQGKNVGVLYTSYDGYILLLHRHNQPN